MVSSAAWWCLYNVDDGKVRKHLIGSELNFLISKQILSLHSRKKIADRWIGDAGSILITRESEEGGGPLRILRKQDPQQPTQSSNRVRIEVWFFSLSFVLKILHFVLSLRFQFAYGAGIEPAVLYRTYEDT